MELTITSMTPADRLYAYNQSSQLEGQTGCIGHLRGDFGGGQEFYTSWFDHRREYKTDEFKAEFDEVVNTLREKDGLLWLYAYRRSAGVMLVIFSSIIVHVLSFSLVGFAPIWPFPVPANIRGGEFARCY